MTPEAQRIAIAEAYGHTPESWRLTSEGWLFADTIPDYLKDLNAMHSAWLTLSNENRFRFQAELQRVLLRDSEPAWLICAEAHHRAEAFLRAVGRWEE